jgi:hypothetical protein
MLLTSLLLLLLPLLLLLLLLLHYYYSFGGTVLEMVSGQPPWSCLGVKSTLQVVITVQHIVVVASYGT